MLYFGNLHTLSLQGMQNISGFVTNSILSIRSQLLGTFVRHFYDSFKILYSFFILVLSFCMFETNFRVYSWLNKLYFTHFLCCLRAEMFSLSFAIFCLSFGAQKLKMETFHWNKTKWIFPASTQHVVNDWLWAGKKFRFM